MVRGLPIGSRTVVARLSQSACVSTFAAPTMRYQHGQRDPRYTPLFRISLRSKSPHNPRKNFTIHYGDHSFAPTGYGSSVHLKPLLRKYPRRMEADETT